MRLIDADALLERCKSNYLTKDDYLFEIRNAPTAYGNGIPVMAVIEQIALDAGLLKNSARGLAWDFPDDDKLLKFGLGFHQAMLANAPTVQREGWVSVDDKLPDYSGTQKRVRVLVYWKDTKTVFTLWYGLRFGLKEPEFYEENEWTESNDGEINESDNLYLGEYLSFKNITHWQNLPAAPTDKE